MIKCFKRNDKLKEEKHLKKKKKKTKQQERQNGKQGLFFPLSDLHQSSTVAKMQCFLLYVYIFPHEQ